jgi:hypothetical protein
VRRALIASTLVLVSVTVSAQTRNQASNAGAAGVTSRLESQGYKDIHNLRPGPDGKWIGQATRNGVPVTVTSDQAGTTIAR